MSTAGSPTDLGTSDPVRLLGEAPLLLLIADSNWDAVEHLAAEFAHRDVEVLWCADGPEALLKAGARTPDVVLAAADLPVLCGAELARALLRDSGTPVIIGVSGSDAQETAAEALTAGAIACVPKPYRLEQVLPMLIATRNNGNNGNAAPPLERGVLRLDPSAVTVHLRGQPVYLPLREFQLLHLLMKRPGTVLRREQIYQLIWGTSANSTTNTLAVHVKRLRGRLGDNQEVPQIIQTVRGVGYRFISPLE